MTELKIEYVDSGVANRFSDGTIELNKKLKDYPKLRGQIIRHELNHTPNSKLNKKDFLHDVTITDQVNQWEVLKFMLTTPSSLSQILPLYYSSKRGWIMDINAVGAWIFFILVIVLGFIIL